MLVNLTETPIDCRVECWSGAVCREESQETVVPDTMPDVGELICASGTLLIRSKDVTQGKLRLEANLPVKAVYRPEEGTGLCCLEMSIPIYLSFEDESIADRASCVADLRLDTLETRLLNPRKLSVRAEIECRAWCYEPGAVTMIGPPERPEPAVHLRTQVLRLWPVCAVTEKTFVLTDEFRLPEDRGPLREILAQQTTISLDETRFTGTKMIVKGTAETRLLCAGEEDEAREIAVSTGFSQVFEAEGVGEDADLCLLPLLSGAYYALDEDGLGGNLEAHVVLQLTASAERQGLCLTDAYSNRYSITPTVEAREECCVIRKAELREPLRERCSTERPVQELVQCLAETEEPQTEPDGASVTVRVLLCYRTEEGQLRAERHSYRQRFVCPLEEGERLCLRSVRVRELSAVPAEGGVELKAMVEARGAVQRCRSLNVITAVEWDENEPADLSDRPALILVRASSDDDLWQLARGNCSTAEAIREANHLDEMPEPWNRLLLIPKTE